ncbi:MAG: DUF2330 domain-containing protein [Nannocystaceae bacterium]|nr:DUF2330 domain-containing protein [Nannocystaceae bacterium]
MKRAGLVLGLAGAVPALLHAAEAQACGGTFCDAGPATSPVDQAAETVLFVRDGDTVEAHVQITIDPATDAQKFAWLVPMPAVPQFDVGSQPLFDALLAASSPSYTVRGATCGGNLTSAGFIQDPDGGAPSREPDVHTQTVGAFEVTVLQGGTVAGVMTWLGDNGYQQDAAAEPILQEYLDQDFVFVALRLTPAADVADIHPIVLRYLGDEPCVPLRLTAIAAQENMGVRVLMLGDTRWAPANWAHVVPNALRQRWGYSEYDYASVVTLAVDAADAGHGFVTEYAGTSETVATDQVYSSQWDASAFVDAAPTDVVTLLNAQGLANCPKGGPCIVAHPLVVAMLRQYLPAPPDVGENQFYECVACYADQADFSSWDGPAFAAELHDRVIAPGEHAAQLLSSWPYLTRLFTTISPAEMTEDPTFQPAPDLPDVAAGGVAVAQCVTCPDDAVATLPDGREVYLEGSTWPSFDEAMPYVERIEQIPPQGAPIVLLDERESIDAQLDAWNTAHACGGGGGGGGGSDDDGSGGIATGGSGSGSAGGGDAGAAEGGDGPGYDGAGCGCGVGGHGGAALPWLLAWVLRPRRRPRTRRTTRDDAPGGTASCRETAPPDAIAACIGSPPGACG